MILLDLETAKNEIPVIQRCKSIQQLDKGFSDETKYVVEMEGDVRVLLRISAAEKYTEKQAEYQMLKNLREFQVRYSEPLAFGTMYSIPGNYMLLSYIDGEDASEALPNLSETVQYGIGVESGMDLAKMHAYRAPGEIEKWHARKARKHQAYVQAYKTCGIKLTHDDRILTFIENHLHLMKLAPDTLQHDDFHPGNLIVNNQTYAGAIDFNRYDWGDPLHDFHKTALFSREISVPFSIGQIHGYFNRNGVPDDFWTMYALYAAMTVFSALVWTQRVTPELLGSMLDRLYLMLEDHKYFELKRPTWYSA